MSQKIYLSDADKLRDSQPKNGGRPNGSKPKALKAASSNKNVIKQAFKPASSPRAARNFKGVKSTISVISRRDQIGSRQSPRQSSANNTRNNRSNNQEGPSNNQQGTGTNVKVKVSTQPIKAKLQTALQTAQSVIRNKQHPKSAEMKILLDSFNKGWVTEKKFLETLPTLVL